MADNNILKWNEDNGSGPGRPKGQTNLITRRIREAFALCLEERIDLLGEMIDRIAVDDPKTALEVIIRISERFVPKLTQTAITGAEGGPIDIKFEFGQKIKPTEDFDIEKL